MIVRKNEIVTITGNLILTQKVRRVEITGDSADTIRVIIEEAGKEYPQVWRIGADEFAITDPPALAMLSGTFTPTNESEEEITRRAITFEQWEKIVAAFQQLTFKDPKIRRYVSDFSFAMTDSECHLVVNTEDSITALSYTEERAPMYQLIHEKWRENQYVSEYGLPTWIEVWEGWSEMPIYIGK